MDEKTEWPLWMKVKMLAICNTNNNTVRAVEAFSSREKTEYIPNSNGDCPVVVPSQQQYNKHNKKCMHKFKTAAPTIIALFLRNQTIHLVFWVVVYPTLWMFPTWQTNIRGKKEQQPRGRRQKTYIDSGFLFFWLSFLTKTKWIGHPEPISRWWLRCLPSPFPSFTKKKNETKCWICGSNFE